MEKLNKPKLSEPFFKVEIVLCEGKVSFYSDIDSSNVNQMTNCFIRFLNEGMKVRIDGLCEKDVFEISDLPDMLCELNNRFGKSFNLDKFMSDYKGLSSFIKMKRNDDVLNSLFQNVDCKPKQD